MVERLFELMFVLTLVTPPTAVAIGALLLLIAPRRPRPITHVPRTAGA